jgi:Lrp/AsnC family transcriptional regulator for asnA, asnC and gidA
VTRKRLDNMDRRIVTLLAEDGRRPYSSIAGDVGLSESSVRQRVARMIRDRVVRITVDANPTEVGFITADVGLRVAGNRHEEVAQALMAVPEIIFVSFCLGEFDMDVEIVCETQEQLFDIVVNRVRAIDAVLDTKVFQHIQILKNQSSFLW